MLKARVGKDDLKDMAMVKYIAKKIRVLKAYMIALI